MKENTILILGALGLGAFVLNKQLKATGDAISETVGGVGEGFSDAFQGVGSGLGMVGESTGSAVRDVFSIFAPMGEMMRQGAENIQDANWGDYWQEKANNKYWEEQHQIQSEVYQDKSERVDEAYRELEENYNINNPEQVRAILFEDLPESRATMTNPEQWNRDLYLAKYISPKNLKSTPQNTTKSAPVQTEAQKKMARTKHRSNVLVQRAKTIKIYGSKYYTAKTPVERMKVVASKDTAVGRSVKANLKKLGW